VGTLLGNKLLVPPPRQGAIGRPRLLERMGGGAGAKVVLVLASPGLGKTTLVARWSAAASADHRTGRVSLDAADNDRRPFWATARA
jgi:LuxR family transcriptional regulator, maltose regulon positive regulatory protein